MYSSLEIAGYRGFDSFRLAGLGQVNLLVGANNCGKTSILECIELLHAGGSPAVLCSILNRRGELDRSRGDGRRLMPVVRHLFAGRELLGRLTIRGEGNAGSIRQQVTVCSEESPHGESLPNGDDELEDDEIEEPTPYILRITSPAMAEPFKTTMTSTGALPEFRFLRPAQTVGPDLFLRTEGMTVSDIGRHFSEVVLTDREQHVLDAMRAVEPAIERVASVAYEGPRVAEPARGGVFVKLRNVEERVPIGSLGDGLWRMLGLALALANCRGGVLLVDEIDTGLHYTVMEKMWRMVSERATALSVQVFATTHSRDCWESLGAIAKAGGKPSGEVTIQRIDRQERNGVRFGKEAILAAAERGLEVR